MLNQVIYTRCSPTRDMKDNGRVVRADGFGIHTFSKELLTDGMISNYDALKSRLAVKNGAAEGSAMGLVHSYEYFLLDGTTVLSYEYARPHCKELRPNGQGHRPGNFIKQALVGALEGYPFEWFGNGVWDAYLRHENDFYLDGSPTAEPAFLPQIAPKQPAGPVEEARIRAFVNDGRAEAVKAGIWFLLKEFAKPENERRVLLIKDVPENVELWVAAITSAFSPKMARKVSFTTNRSRLGTATDQQLFTYTDAAGRPLMQPNAPDRVRHPICMIVGFHPKDNYCNGVKAMPASNFQIIDGTTKTCSFQLDEPLTAAYYAAAVRGGEDFKYFTRVILNGLGVEDPIADLPEIYAAATFLMDGENKPATWRYEDVLRHISTITRYGLTSLKLTSYLLDNCLLAYPNILMADRASGFPLLKKMQSLAKTTGKEQEVIGAVADVLCGCMNDLYGHGKDLTMLWSSVESGGLKRDLEPVLGDIFSDAELPIVTRNIRSAAADTVDTVMSMFMTTTTLSQVRGNEAKFEFFCTAVCVLSNDTARATKWLSAAKNCPGLLMPCAAAVASMLGSADRMLKWWELVMEAGSMDAPTLCRDLCRQEGANMDLVETLLTKRVHKERQCDRDTYVAFRDSMKALPCTEDTGLRFFRKWLEVAGLREYTQIIRKLEECRLSKKVELELFREADKNLPMEYTKEFDLTMASEIERWCQRLGVASRNATLAKFKREFEHSRTPDDAVVTLERLIQNRISIDRGFIDKDFYIQIAAVAGRHYDPKVHLAFLCAFDATEEAVRRRYVDSYVYYVLENARNRELLDAVISLCAATVVMDKIRGRSTEYVDQVTEWMEKSILKHLEHYYKPNMAEQLAKDPNIRSEVKDKCFEVLDKIAQTIAEKKAQRGGFIQNLFGGLFGKKDSSGEK